MRRVLFRVGRVVTLRSGMNVKKTPFRIHVFASAGFAEGAIVRKARNRVAGSAVLEAEGGSHMTVSFPDYFAKLESLSTAEAYSSIASGV